MARFLTLCGAGLLTVFALQPALASVEVENFWLRESIPGQPNGAGFGKFVNSGSDDRVLVGASSTIAEDVEIHRHVRDGEQMRMEAMDALVIPAGEEVVLQPGGYHLMLMQLQRPLVVGEEHDLVLIFSDGTTIEVKVPVKSLVDSSSRGHGHRH
ncbi:MAG: copper chaperone PCu(A)C [Aliidiomarina sp.]|uniref:copper chaperone PCu(A)C n=1 Tax=Aliidiomarina sp. TaxID=1872439 RepID=UPI0025BCFB44|nr:copper chaperone PCu(A)C [Aliidiomarina sp.]MCH8502372.1 copper chaperone PCu(A)C [Aliidiomarina sp.]